MHYLYKIYNLSLSFFFFITGEMGCSVEMTTIIAMLQVQNVFAQPTSGQASIKARVAHRMFEVEEGDLIKLLNVYTAYEKQNKNGGWCHKFFLNSKALKRATEIRAQMRKLIKKLGIPLTSCSGWFTIFIIFLSCNCFNSVLRTMVYGFLKKNDFSYS